MEHLRNKVDPNLVSNTLLKIDMQTKLFVTQNI